MYMNILKKELLDYIYAHMNNLILYYDCQKVMSPIVTMVTGACIGLSTKLYDLNVENIRNIEIMYRYYAWYLKMCYMTNYFQILKVNKTNTNICYVRTAYL